MKKNVIIYGAIIGFLLIGLIAASIVAVLAIRGASTITTTSINGTSEEKDITPTEEDEIVLTTPIIINTPIPMTTSTPVKSEMEMETPVVEEETAPTSKPASGSCGLTGQRYILLIGQDNNEGLPPYGAEAIRILKVDFDEYKAVSFAFQRDLYLSSPHLNTDYGIKNSLLGTVYHYAYQRVGNQANAHSIATNAVAQVIYDNFEIIADHYITIDQDLISNVIDLVGGIEVNIPEDLTTSSQSFTAGTQTLSGDQAAAYMGYKASISDEWNRIKRQDLILNALSEKLLSSEIMSQLDELYEQVSGSVITDFSLEDVLTFICIFKEFPTDEVEYHTFTEDMLTVNGDQLKVNDLESAKEYVQSQFEW